MVIEYVPPLPAAGVPLKTPAELNVTPEGNAPISLKVGAGKPVAVTVNVPLAPTVNVALPTLVIAGAWSTFMVRLAVAVWGGVAESVAVTVKVKAPLCVGIPERTPDELKLIPGGSPPEVTAQVTDPVPFEAVSVVIG
jgi:hypothetical protein